MIMTLVTINYFEFVSVSKALIICICISISDINNLHLNQYQ